MKVLVTGASGRVGSRLVPRLVEKGHTVRVLLRREPQDHSLRQAGVEIGRGDLLQPRTLPAAVAGVDAIVHVAAFFRGATEVEARAVNVDGTLALGRAALDAGVPHFVNISTTLVYGPGRGRPAREEDEPRPPAGRFYPISKLAAERGLMECYGSRNRTLTTLRLAFVYGEGDPHLGETANLMTTWPAAKRLQLVHHADVAQAILFTLAKPEATSQIYNVADDTPMPIGEIRRRAGVAGPEDAGSIIDDTWEGIVDTRKIKTDLGFKPIHPSLYEAERSAAL